MTREPLPMQVTSWKISAAWGAKELDCTLAGIQERCGAGCCTAGPGNTYWPGTTGANGNCHNLGPQGCVLGDTRPVTCLLYPLRLSKTGTIGLHVRGLTGCCRKTYRVGGRSIIENLRPSLVILFGEEVSDRIIENVLAGNDAFVTPPDWVLEALDLEATWEALNEIPLARTTPTA